MTQLERQSRKQRPIFGDEGEMKYDLFLFDADDTLFDFQKSEAKSFRATLGELGVKREIDDIYAAYKDESSRLWELLEKGMVTKDFLKVERFRRTFCRFNIDSSPERASDLYLEILPETVVLLDHAIEICEFLGKRGEVGIVTNGIESVQKRRLKNSGLSSHISFMAVSEECGFAKPDVRFFEHATKMARTFERSRTIVIGDRLETDIRGAQNFGVDACFFNPLKTPVPDDYSPQYEIGHLSELREVVCL